MYIRNQISVFDVFGSHLRRVNLLFLGKGLSALASLFRLSLVSVTALLTRHYLASHQNIAPNRKGDTSKIRDK